MVSRSPSVTISLADFGLAKALGSSTHTAIGTPLWAAPEQKDRYHDTYDEKVDMWAVGCVVHYLLTSLHPFSTPAVDTELPTTDISKKYRYPFWPPPTRREFDSLVSPSYQNVVRGISNTANGFINNLISLEARSRMSAHEALQHKWICPAESTPLEAALKKGDLPLSRLLARYDHRYTPRGWAKPLTAAQSLIVLRVAAAHGQHALAKDAIETMPTEYLFSFEISGWRSRPALVGAAAIGNLEIVEELLMNLSYPEKRDGVLLEAFQAALSGRHHGVVNCLWPRFPVREFVWIDQLKMEIASFGNADLVSKAIETLKQGGGWRKPVHIRGRLRGPAISRREKQ